MVAPLIIYGAWALGGALIGAGGVILYDKLSDQQKKKLKDLEDLKEMNRKETEYLEQKHKNEITRLQEEVQIKQLRNQSIQLDIELLKLKRQLAEDQANENK